MSSYKTEVIEQLFDARWSDESGSLRTPLVTLGDVQDGIRAYNGHHGTEWSTMNPANFFKDFIRRRDSANRNWPTSVLERGYTARQSTGGGQVFEFVPVKEGQTDAFPIERLPSPTEETPRHAIQSVSLPLASRKLGRDEETWLTQVLVRLHVIETHLSVYSPHDFQQVDHLQMSMKLRRAEVESVYLALGDGDEQPLSYLVICEAKGSSDDILEDQILAQTRAAGGLDIEVDFVLPVAAKVIRNVGIQVVEFRAVERDRAREVTDLAVVSQAVYQLSPPVPGIG